MTNNLREFTITAQGNKEHTTALYYLLRRVCVDFASGMEDHNVPPMDISLVEREITFASVVTPEELRDQKDLENNER